jgi:hypothetical protein
VPGFKRGFFWWNQCVLRNNISEHIINSKHVFCHFSCLVGLGRWTCNVRSWRIHVVVCSSVFKVKFLETCTLIRTWKARSLQWKIVEPTDQARHTYELPPGRAKKWSEYKQATVGYKFTALLVFSSHISILGPHFGSCPSRLCLPRREHASWSFARTMLLFRRGFVRRCSCSA